MIVPSWIVRKIYKTGSLKKEGGFYSFCFINRLASGKIVLTGPTTISIASPFGYLELDGFPKLLVDGEEIKKEDVIMSISGQELPRYDDDEAKNRVGEGVEFPKGTEIRIKIKGNLSDGKHNFQVTFNSKQFGSFILNFSDYIGLEPRISFWQRIKNIIFGIKKEEVKLDTSKYIIVNKKPDVNFERIRKAILCKEPDRVPLIELAIDEEVKSAFLGRQISDMKDEVEFWLQAGYDYVSLFAINIIPKKVEVISSHKTTYKEEMQERAFVDETKGVITNFEEFEKYPWPETQDLDMIIFEEIDKYLPKEMKVIGCFNGVFEPVSQAMGLTTFCYSLIDNLELISAMFNKMGDLQLQILKKMVELPFVGAVWIGDDIAYKTSTIISPEHLRKYVFPYYKKFCDIAKSKNLPVLLHSDGNLTAIIDDLIDCGISALHPVEPGAMDIKELKEKYKGKLCLCGNIDLSYTLPRGTIKEVEEEVKKKIKDLAEGGGYCLGSSNSVPNYVPLENFIAMNRTCLRYGKYPISI